MAEMFRIQFSFVSIIKIIKLFPRFLLAFEMTEMN